MPHQAQEERISRKKVRLRGEEGEYLTDTSGETNRRKMKFHVRTAVYYLCIIYSSSTLIFTFSFLPSHVKPRGGYSRGERLFAGSKSCQNHAEESLFLTTHSLLCIQ